MATNRPWDRLTGEGDAPWAAFEHYRMTNPDDRLVRNTAKVMGRSRNTYLNYCRKYKWRARAKAWDDHISASYDKEVINVAQEKARAQMDLWDDLLAIAAAKAKDRLEALGTDEDEDADLREIVLLAKESTLAQRLILGEATARDEQRHTVDVEKLSDAARAALRLVMDEAGVDNL